MTEELPRYARVGPYEAGPDHPWILLAGPCVIESEARVLRIAEHLAGVRERTGLSIVFKASFDKANRSSLDSFRGPGLEAGLRILEKVKKTSGLPLVTDVHETAQVAAVGQVVDVLQIPAFLCRQTDLLVAAARTGRTVNVKKGQFLAPWDMRNVVEKVRAAGGEDLLLTERGVSFGYNTLVTDFRGLPQLAELGAPVIFDATHSVQQPGGRGATSGGERRFIPTLARAAAAVGVDGFFMETHDEPEQAKSDGPNQWPLDRLEGLLKDLLRIREAVAERNEA